MTGDAHSIRRVGPDDLRDVLGLMRAYCDFYEVSPTDEDLLGLSRALLEDPEHEGVQLLARDTDGRPAGFATIYWSWSTAGACRIGVMNDLFVVRAARGRGLADALIAACRSECLHRGARTLSWQTALDNVRAQAVYARVGASAERWIDYSLPCLPG